jgi:hypothetical protein
MSSSYAKILKQSNGTFSNGASQINFENRWNQKLEDNINLQKLEAPTKCSGYRNTNIIIFPKKLESTVSKAGITLKHGLIRQREQNKIPNYLERIHNKFHIIKGRQENWDDKGSKKPNSGSIYNATNILTDILNSVVENGNKWINPFISSDEDGDINIEWHFRKHQLHLEITEESTEYIKVWGENIEDEMWLGTFNKNDHLVLWYWLLNG